MIPRGKIGSQRPVVYLPGPGTQYVGEGGQLLIEEVLRRGQLQRGEATRITGRPERTAREILRKLIDAGLLMSETAKGPVMLRFSAGSVDTLFPRLFPA